MLGLRRAVLFGGLICFVVQVARETRLFDGGISNHGLFPQLFTVVASSGIGAYWYFASSLIC